MAYGKKQQLRRETLAEVKKRAFDANDLAKRTSGSEREAHYGAKHAAINYLLETGYAFVDSVDWWADDPVLGVTFVDGGMLHTTLSALSPWALRRVRRQLNGGFSPNRASAYRQCQVAKARLAA